MVVNNLYQLNNSDVNASMAFSADFIAQILHDIYQQGRKNNNTNISPALFKAILEQFNNAANEGFSASSAPDPDDDFRQALRHSNEVFSAFKVHRMQNDMANLLTDSNGDLKPFNQWANEVLPIASHQCGAWLQTEYDTAVLRAHQAADWQQFLREADVLPNLKWMPSTSPNPGPDHQIFWNVIRPIADPFWNEHRPGDRWNCKCSLTSTDETPTSAPMGDNAATPQPGLDANPATDNALFAQSHPYFPSSCDKCDFYKPNVKARLKYVFANRKKDCYNCPYIDGCISRTSSDGFKLQHKAKNGGKLYIHTDVDKDKADYNDMKQICLQLAKLGHEVRLTPRLHCKSDEYKKIYAPLIGTKYENKCPDFSVNGVFYEYESFAKPWNKNKVKNMLSHGLKQSSRVVINNTKGCSDRFIRKAIMARVHLPGQQVDEVWIYEKGNVRLFYKDKQFYNK